MNEVLYAGSQPPASCPDGAWCLVLCRAGSAELAASGWQGILGAGDAALIPQGASYRCGSEAADCLHLALMAPAPLRDQPFNLRPACFDWLWQAASAAAYHWATPSAAREALLGAYGAVIAAYLAPTKMQSKHGGIVAQIEQHILAHYADSGYELDAYLRTLPFSYDYLRKLFQSEMGYTPHQFLMEKRLQSAASLLRSPAQEQSMAEISRLCGFREPL